MAQAKQCSHEMAEIVETTEATGEGYFYELYECQCGATGRIEGQEDEPPAQWTRTGEVFDQ